MSETTIECPVTFTENALKEIKKVLAGSENENLRLRVGVKGGGCSGLSYVLGLDNRQEDDLEYETQGVSFIMNKAHGIYLLGMQIDYGEGLNARGFIFENPNASSTCGCGTSFAV